MDEKEIASGPIGNAGKYDVSFKDGKLVITVTETDAIGDTVIARSIGVKPVLEALKKAIPGTIDDAIFNLIETALGV